MSSHQGSRKRLKISPTGMAPTASASMSSTSRSGNAATRHDSCQHEQSLKAVQTDVDTMRQLVTCKICSRLLYEPYALSCGHTYCYICLTQWFETNPRKKTCPDCRSIIIAQPTPSYIVKELVLVFVSRSELLPDKETSEEHHTWAREEAELVAKDRANTDPREGGLFKGLFKGGVRRGGIHDPGDGVTRCPSCHWELEEGYCNNCDEVVDHGFSEYDDDDDSDVTDDELDHEIDEADAAAIFGVDGHDDYLGNDMLNDIAEGHYTIGAPWPPSPPPPARRRGTGGARAPIGLRSSDDEDESEEDEHDEDGDLDGFVAGDDEVAYASSEEGGDTDMPATSSPWRLDRRRGPVIISDDEGDTVASAGAHESEEDSEDEGPIARGSQRNKRGPITVRQRRARAISSDEDSSENEHAGHDSDVRETGGFSPLDGSVNEDAIDLRSGYESRHPSNFHSPPDGGVNEDAIDLRRDYESGRAGDFHSDRGSEPTYDMRSDYESEAASSIHPMVEEDEEEDDDESNGSDDDDGWGFTEGETPYRTRQPAPSAAHRLQTRGQHSNRYTGMFGSRSNSAMSPTMASRTATATYPDRSYHRPSTAQLRPNRHNSIGDPTTLRARPRAEHPPSFTDRRRARPISPQRPFSSQNSLQPHPFQLENTLANVNSAYNRRNQQLRSNQGHSTHSAASSRSSLNGGVDVDSSGSSGSSNTVRPSSSGGRRKRHLSISSDESMEARGGFYDD
ncbi:E3 ubiquitin ligase [Vermiconidia calcicola]|uniref:E3 ubiquitin ligase n=1 Tax=Vermiconidia calcicola TaxID=1690605 RepID=A0ACC3NAH1_9PEZI|nr:E3 ubiquitin ligase [Vermiconidia calcicola]